MRMERLVLAAVFFVGCGGSSGNKNDGGATPTQDLSVPDLSMNHGNPDLAGGGKEDGGSSVGEDGGVSPPVAVGPIQTSTSTKLGTFLVDGNGRTLYMFGNDVPAGASSAAVTNCLTACLAVWPVFHLDTVTVGGTLSAGDFAEFTRSDGAKQTTYKGWPLYYFQADGAAGAGSTLGQGKLGVWFVVAQPFYNTYVRGDATQKNFLTDGAGRSLYNFTNDTRGTSTTPPVSACTAAACSGPWPAFTLSPTIAPSTLLGTDFTILNWADGTTKQLVYKGWPLYYFAGDTAPGNTSGRGLDAGAWNTLDPTAP